MTEFGAGVDAAPPGNLPNPNNVEPAINLAERIVGDMTVLRPKAWIQWDGIESLEVNTEDRGQYGVSWGLIWAKYGEQHPTEDYSIAKQYYGYKNFTKFIRPGDRIIASGDKNTLAGFNPQNGTLSLVAYNDQPTSRSVTYDLSKFGFTASATPYRTSGTESFVQLPDTAVSNNSLSVTLSPNSVTTYVLSDRTSVDDQNIGTGRNQFDYSSPWTHKATPDEPGAYLHDNSWSGITNQYYQVRFNGTKADLYGAKAPNHGIAAVSIDNGPETNVDFYAPTRIDGLRVYSSPVLAPGTHTLKVRVTGTKNSASAGVYVPADRVDITEPGRTKLNDYTTGTATNQFEFVGAWSKGAQDDAWQKDNHWSGTAATDYYQVRFKGTKVNVYGAKAPNHGIAAVSIDGGPETNVDFYAPTRMDNILAWSSPVLGAGSHTLKVRATGMKNNNTTSPSGYIPADRVDVFP